MNKKTSISLLALVAVLGLGVGYWHFSGLAPHTILRQGDDARRAAEGAEPSPVDVPVPQEAPGTDQTQTASSEPRIELLRVEPDGAMVMAGLVQPERRVILTNGRTLIAEERSGPGGDFVFAPVNALPVGSHRLRLHVEDGNGEMVVSEQSALVNVPERGRENDLMVMLEEPGQASRLLVTPQAAPHGDRESEVAALPSSSGGSAAGANAPSQRSSGNGAAGDADRGSVPGGDTGAPISQTTDEALQGANASEGTAASAAGGENSDPTGNGGSEPSVVTAQDGGAEAQRSETGSQTADLTEEAAEARAQTANALHAAVGAETPRPMSPPPGDLAIAAVEIEREQLYVAGRAEPGSTVQLYLDDAPVARVENTTTDEFLASAQVNIEPGRRIVRADSIARDGSVVARVEVPFERSEGERMAALAPRTPPQPAEAEAEAGVEPATAGGREASVRGSQPSGDSAMQPELEPVEGRVLIRRGDTLWQISREAYGQGRRYTVIYLANGDQIRDPHLIYPGQVFRMPEMADGDG